MSPRIPRAAWCTVAAGLLLGLAARHDARAQDGPGTPAPSPSAIGAAPSSASATSPAASSSAPASASASPAPSAGPSGDEKAAERAFVAGEKLFAKGDFLQAATSFDEAYSRAPHASSSWNAARSWHRAGELDRAANRYARFLAEAPVSSPDRDAALRALRELSPKLGRFDVRAEGATSVQVDGQLVALSTVYVYPGAHVLSARIGERTVQRSERVEAGSVTSVVLRDEPAPPSAAPASSAAAASAPPPVVTSVFIVPAPTAPPAPTPIWPLRGLSLGLALVTVALASVTIASGLDTLGTRGDYDAAVLRGDDATARSLFAEGVSKQQRTNVLLGSLVGAAALTGGAIVWLVLAESPRPSKGSAGGAMLGIRGDF